MAVAEGTPALEVIELTKTFGRRKPVTAVAGLSFAMARGEILGLLGPNGAGKTTTIQMLLSTLTPTSGRILYDGRDLARHRSAILAKVGYASAYSKLPSLLSVEENLDVFARLYDMPAGDRKARTRVLLDRFGMWDNRKRTMSALSAGQTTRVTLCKAFLPRPEIVLLDEPTASLDPDVALEVRDFVRQQCEEDGVSVLHTSHNMDEVAEICHRVVFLDRGRIAAEGRPSELAATVAWAKVRLKVDRGLDDVARIAAARELDTTQEEGGVIEVEIDEPDVAGFLAALASADVRYTEIAIRKPTLEDYFLHIARRRGEPDPAPTAP
ncbi:ABC transporter ATP-binding protein [Paludisphaera mucosa]|uniref:ABC transporter ATP-binding protein n=1 Tax=Paludisphaera mucosa TaxID=3030827 RepID=A0ABT6FJQ6_9BACT|nr:ABC transporter ATP-binding protein [Paludisphaera mucosa]MDG3007615.1 ABC transporter ATP-binding protein [Paludisphaera mucosa]